MKTYSQHIGLLGHGVVGSGVEQILTKKEIKKILTRHSVEDSLFTTNIEDILQDKDVDIVIECIGGEEPAFTYIKQALLAKKHVVTSNKKVMALHAKELYDLAHKQGVYLGIEACVAGGIPWIHSLQHVRRIDSISSIQGIFNGTTNYILSSIFQTNRSFIDALHQAQDLGYAEQDPSDDIDGNDIRYKIALSSMIAFDTIFPLDSIITYGIRHLSDIEIQYALENNYILKLIGKADRNHASVFPTFLKNSNMLASISSNYNAVQCTSTTLGTSIYVGQGAGSLPTAHSVVQDVKDIENQAYPTLPSFLEANVQEDELARFYIRTKNIQTFSSIPHTVLQDNVLITDKIAYTSIAPYKEDIVFLAEVEND